MILKIYCCSEFHCKAIIKPRASRHAPSLIFIVLCSFCFLYLTVTVSLAQLLDDYFAKSMKLWESSNVQERSLHQSTCFKTIYTFSPLDIHFMTLFFNHIGYVRIRDFISFDREVWLSPVLNWYPPMNHGSLTSILRSQTLNNKSHWSELLDAVYWINGRPWEMLWFLFCQ